MFSKTKVEELNNLGRGIGALYMAQKVLMAKMEGKEIDGVLLRNLVAEYKAQLGL